MRNKLLLTAMICGSALFSQAQGLTPAPADKAVIYFVRASSLGFAINFSYFDSTKLIGKFNGPKYMRYECDPGKHLFWARSENRDFIEADVEAGKIYFIEAVPQMGAVKAGVKLVPVDPTKEKKMNKLIDFINKKNGETFTGEKLEKQNQDFEDVISRGIEKYQEEKAKGKAAARLEKTMFYNQ